MAVLAPQAPPGASRAVPPVTSMTPQPELIDYVVIATYLVLMVLVGLTFRSLNRDTSDYFRNGCKGTWWLIGMSSFMVGFSAWTFTGAAGVAYESGWSVLILYWGNAAGFACNFLLTGPWFRQLRCVTMPEVLRNRFNTTTQQVYAYTGIPIGCLYAGLFLYGLSIFSSAVFGYNVQLTIVVLGAVVVLYCVAGGSWAVTGTDFLQGVVLVPTTILIAFLCLREIGGVGAFFAAIESQGLARDYRLINEPGRFPGNEFALGWVSAMFVQNVVTANSLTAAPKFFAVKDGRDARKASLLAGSLFLFGSALWFVPPMCARLLYADQVAAFDGPASGISQAREVAFVIASLNVLPAGLIGLVVVCVFTATMSSLDTGINKNAAVIVRDIFPKLKGRFKTLDRSDESMVGLSRWVSLLLGLGAVLAALYFSFAEGRGIFSLMLDLMALLGLPLGLPLVFALFIRRVPQWSCLFAAGVTLVPSTLAFFSEDLFGETWTIQKKIAVNFIVCFAAFCSTLPFWRHASPAYQEKVDLFFTTMHKPVDFAKEVGVGNDGTQFKILGFYTLVIGGLLALLALHSNSLEDRLAVLALSGSILLCGVGLLAAAARLARAAGRVDAAGAPPASPDRVRV